MLTCGGRGVQRGAQGQEPQQEAATRPHAAGASARVAPGGDLRFPPGRGGEGRGGGPGNLPRPAATPLTAETLGTPAAPWLCRHGAAGEDAEQHGHALLAAPGGFTAARGRDPALSQGSLWSVLCSSQASSPLRAFLMPKVLSPWGTFPAPGSALEGVKQRPIAPRSSALCAQTFALLAL